LKRCVIEREKERGRARALAVSHLRILVAKGVHWASNERTSNGCGYLDIDSRSELARGPAAYPFGPAGLLLPYIPGMLRARTGGCAPLSSQFRSLPFAARIQVRRGSIRGAYDFTIAVVLGTRAIIIAIPLVSSSSSLTPARFGSSGLTRACVRSGKWKP